MPMNLNGSAIIAKKRATNPELRGDRVELLRKSKKNMEKREAQLPEKAQLIREVKEIKKKSIEHLDEVVFRAAKNIKGNGVKVFIAKKPIDVAEYIRGFVNRDRIGIVPSPQTMEAEVMQAFFMSNKAHVLSEKYSNQERGIPSIHPYFPYPRERGEPEAEREIHVGGLGSIVATALSKEAKKPEVAEPKHVVLSAIILTENGNIYVERDEMEALKKFKDPFVIVTADRIFSEADADKVEHLMEISSGGAIKAEKTTLMGHLIILDNSRLALARGSLGKILNCINCYACSLYCPIYLAVGGLFGSPMMAGIGALSVSYQSGLKSGVNRGLYYCTLCRRCEVECPVDVPIAKLTEDMRKRTRFIGL